MSKDDDDAQSVTVGVGPTIVQAYHQAWTSGDVDLAMTYVSEDVRCFAPDPDVATKTDWRKYLSGFVPMLTGAPELARMADGDRFATHGSSAGLGHSTRVRVNSSGMPQHSPADDAPGN